MARLIHGGDVSGYRLEYGSEPLDFSANCNPLGVPEGVVAAVGESAALCCAYPDPLCRALCAAIGQKLGVPEEYVLCGNGSADLIFRLASVLGGRPALVTAPGFAEYSLAAEAAGSPVERFFLKKEKNFALTEDFLGAITPGVALVFLCSPNNPTGLSVPRELLLRIAEKCEEADAVLMLDECFNGFLDSPAERTLLPFLPRFKNLVILRAFTKLYGMAGLRLGCALSSNAELVEKMRAAGQPWAVSTVAQAAGMAALGEDAYVERARALVHTERAFLKERLSSLGLEVLSGEANYVFFRSDDAALASKLRQAGVLLRDCGNFAGLEPGYFRAAVKTHEENMRFTDAIRTVLGGYECQGQ